MASMKKKAAYLLSTASFFVWVFVLLSVCFPYGALSNQINFPNQFMFNLFFGSAIIVAVFCFLIGLNFLGFNFKIKQRRLHFPRPSKPSISIQSSQLTSEIRTNEAKPNVESQKDPTEFFTLPQLEKNQVTD